MFCLVIVFESQTIDLVIACVIIPTLYFAHIVFEINFEPFLVLCQTIKFCLLPFLADFPSHCPIMYLF